MLRIKKKRAVRLYRGFCGWFLPTESPRNSKRQLRTVTWPIHRLQCRWNHREIQNGKSVWWRALFIVRLADRITDGIMSSVNPSAKVNISPLCLPSPISPSSSPSQLSPTANNQTPLPPAQKKKSPFFLSTTSHISWSLLVTASVFWFTDGFLSVFVSNSIF
jgi:hypothetical protein